MGRSLLRAPSSRALCPPVRGAARRRMGRGRARPTAERAGAAIFVGVPDIPPDFVLPAYGRLSVAELPATIGVALGVTEGWTGPALEPAARVVEGGPYDRVVMILIDGLGWDRWQVPSSPVAPLRERVDAMRGVAARLTSVAPSTTAAATTTLLGDGSAPAAHGMLGYTARLPGLGLVANLLFWRPEYGPREGASLEAWGIRPEGFLRRPSLFQVLGKAGVASHVLMPRAIARSPLSRAQMNAASVNGSFHLEDALNQLDLRLARAEGPAFGYVYLDEIDGLGHRDGPQGAAGQAVLGALAERLGAWLDRLAARATGSTLVIVTADHGHVATDPAHHATWTEEPRLAELTSSPPGGEPRHVYLYARDGAASDLEAACRETYGDRFAVVAGGDALASGLYGPPAALHPEARVRVGDVVLLAKGPATFWLEAPADPPLGMHGSLMPAEMHVPFAAFRP